MKISVFGLGYVGLVSAVCFAELGHKVIGVDVNQDRINAINEGRSPIPIKKLSNLIKKQTHLYATHSYAKAILNSNISFVCVQTPSKINGDIDLNALKSACRQIGVTLKLKKEYHIIVIRSTVFPGTFEVLKEVIEKASKLKCGEGFGLVLNPEFLREKTAVDDFFNPCYIVVGSNKREDAYKVINCYDEIESRKFVVSVDVTQMIKYLNNSWHACKVSFTNEIGRICEKANIDGDSLMRLFCQDKVLNISTKYHKIGEAFSGHCLKGDTLIQTEGGLVQIKDINIGMKVYGHDGKLHRITRKFKRNINEDIFEIRPRSLFSFSITTEHPVLAVSRKFKCNPRTKKIYNNKVKDWIPKWIMSEDLRRGDYLVFPVFREKKRVKELDLPSKKNRPDLINKFKVDSDFMRLLGYYLAEGHIDTYKVWRVGFSFHEKEANYINDVKNIAKKIFNYKTLSLSQKNSKAIVTYISSPRLSRLIKKLCGTGAKYKKIARKIMLLPSELQKDLIKGAWRGDGSKSTNVWTWTTISRELFNQMKILLLRQKIAFTTITRKERISSYGSKLQRTYTIGIRNYNEIKKMNILMNDYSIKKELKQNYHKTIWIENGFMYYPICKISKKKFRGKVYNIEVENANSYLCESATLHNCLPKDLSVLQYRAKKFRIKTPLIQSISESNDIQKRRDRK